MLSAIPRSVAVACPACGFGSLLISDITTGTAQCTQCSWHGRVTADGRVLGMDEPAGTRMQEIASRPPPARDNPALELDRARPILARLDGQVAQLERELAALRGERERQAARVRQLEAAVAAR